VLDHPQVAQTLHSLQDTLRAFGQLARDGQGLVRQGQQAMPPLERSLASLDKSLAGVQKLLDSRSGDLDAIIQNLAATLKEMRALTTGLDTMLQKTGPSGDEAIKALERDLRSTEELLELLKAKPSRVVWGKPSQAEREAAAEKVRAARQAQGAKP
jgi:ABC-type transporter Mla subunit MlaD